MVARRLATGQRARPGRLRLEKVLPIALFGLSSSVILVGGGSALNLLFAPTALLIGLYLYLRFPSRDYIAFCYWLWMLTPFIRRLADWQSGFQPISPIMVAPVLVSSLTLLTLARTTRFPMPSVTQAFQILLAVCLYGTVLGLLQGGFAATAFSLLNWLIPITMALHILTFWRDAEEMARSLFRTLAWGALLMGIYGVLQYFQPQPWDIYWMLTSQMTSIGRPEPQGIRLFSTMNSPGPFGIFLMAGLLALLSGAARKIRWFAAAPALVAFLLTLARSAWGGLVIGLFVMLMFAKGKARVRYIMIATASLIVAIPLLAVGPIAERVQGRMETLTAIEEDNSFQVRVAIYADLSASILSNIFGYGMGSTGASTKLSTSDGELGEFGHFDSGILNLFYMFGLVGAFIFILGIVVILSNLFRFSDVNDWSRISTAIFIGVIAMNVFANTFSGVIGMLVFPMAALALVQYPYARNFGLSDR